jgi:hypothetical protein
MANGDGDMANIEDIFTRSVLKAYFEFYLRQEFLDVYPKLLESNY